MYKTFHNCKHSAVVSIALLTICLFSCRTPKLISSERGDNIEHNIVYHYASPPASDATAKAEHQNDEMINVVTAPETEPDQDAITGQSAEDIAASQIVNSDIHPKSRLDFNKSIMEYTYVDGLFYEIYTSMGQITDLRLEPGENMTGQPIIADPGRWGLYYAVSNSPQGTIQHIFISPKEPQATTTLVILTDRRIYYLKLRTFEDSFMMAVRFRYLDNNVPMSSSLQDNTALNSGRGGYKVDPQKIDFNFSISGNAPFRPTICYCDGIKTFIQLDPSFANTSDSPVLYFVPAGKKSGDAQLINYRVDNGTFYIADMIIPKGSAFLLKSEREEVWIKRI